MAITRFLGQTGLRIPPLVFGCNVLGWSLDLDQSFEILDRSFQAGIRAYDTADVYSRWAPGNSGGESETILGKWIRSRGIRNEVVLITKVGMDVGQGKVDLSSKHIHYAAQRSLERLQTERIDLYFSHKDDPDTPLSETLTAHSELIAKGSVAHIGASNYRAERLLESLREAKEHKLPPYEVIQPEYNLYSRKAYEETLAPVAVAESLGVIPYYALAKGFLTGKYHSEADSDKSVRGKGAVQYLDQRGRRILQALAQVAQEYEVTQAAVALAWLMARPTVSAPIASATSPAHITAFEEALRLQLSAADMHTLTEASEPA